MTLEQIEAAIRRADATPLTDKEIELDEITFGMMMMLEATGNWHLEDFCAANPSRADELREFVRDYEDLQVRLLFVEAA
ncbi:MAG TPA: hypothetical protein VN519_06325 [Bryobacteraceae bacterium]|nr:hypothetical protein [Bryobacteraceae bacterium]